MRKPCEERASCYNNHHEVESDIHDYQKIRDCKESTEGLKLLSQVLPNLCSYSGLEGELEDGTKKHDHIEYEGDFALPVGTEETCATAEISHANLKSVLTIAHVRDFLQLFLMRLRLFF